MNVLFLGNSYTYYNDMPKLFEALCAERGLDVTVDSVTAPNYTLALFLDASDELGAIAADKLANGAYNFVVMQEYSHVPASAPDVFLADAATLAAKVRAAGAIPVFYETWARADGNEVLIRYGWTHEEEQALLRAAYEKAADENGAILVRAGERFSAAYRAGEDVFDPDGSHPSENGSRLVAKAFCDTLFCDGQIEAKQNK